MNDRAQMLRQRLLDAKKDHWSNWNDWDPNAGIVEIDEADLHLLKAGDVPNGVAVVVVAPDPNGGPDLKPVPFMIEGGEHTPFRMTVRFGWRHDLVDLERIATYQLRLRGALQERESQRGDVRILNIGRNHCLELAWYEIHLRSVNLSDAFEEGRDVFSELNRIAGPRPDQEVADEQDAEVRPPEWWQE